MNLKLLLLTVMFSAFPAHADWKYDAETDEMSGKKAHYARVTSTNSLDLSFPYSGNNRGHLTVRQHPKHGLDVVVTVEKGQIMCSSYGGCPIAIRFDDAAPVQFHGVPPEDHKSTVAFLKNPQRFINAASKAKRIKVQFNMFQNGAPILTFDTTAPLQWSAPKKK